MRQRDPAMKEEHPFSKESWVHSFMSAADRLASALVEIAARTPGTKKDELRPASYVELVLYLADRKTTHGPQFNPSASEIYDRLDVGSEDGRGRVERVGVTNIRSNELLGISEGSVNFAGFDGDGKKQWSAPEKTTYQIGELPKQTVAAAEDLEITLGQRARATLAKAAEKAAEPGRPEEATEELAQALGDVGTEGEPGGDADHNQTHKRDGALGYGTRQDSTGCDPASAPTDGEKQGSESMWKSHVGGTLREKVPAPKTVSDALEDELASIDAGEYDSVLRRLVAHVYYCQTRMPDRYGDGVPVGHELIKKACGEDETATVPTKTEKVWAVAEGVILDVSDYIYREDDVGRSREFTIREAVLSRLDEALADGYQYKTRYNLVDGTRLYSGFQTELTYDGEHSWEERSTFIYKTLKRLRGQRDLVNKAAVENHLADLEDDVEAAKAVYNDAEEELRRIENEILEEGKSLTDEENDRIQEARETAYEAGRELERTRSRYRQDVRIWSDIVAQGLEEDEDQPEGIYEYETAYEVQMASGRLTQTCGLQNASSAMKAAAAEGVVGIKDKDISSSQTEALIQEMKMAVQMGADLDVSILIDYIDEDGKDGLAEQFGIDRESWKRPEHAVKFGAGFSHDTFEAALSAAKGKVLARIKDEDGEPDFSRLHQFEDESGKSAWRRAVYNELPTTAQTARDWADDPDTDYDDPEAVYSMLKDAYEEMAEEIDAWRDWLVDEYWTEAGRHGSGFGYYVSNPCGIPFSKHDPRLAESGEPDRYSQKTGFATSRLQGLEAAYIHALVLIQDDFDYEVLRNEHDGAVILGEISKKAKEMARLMSGFHRAELETKPFECEDTPCDTTTSKPQSTQDLQEKPSRSRTSPSAESCGDGSADGRQARAGARNERTPSGPSQTSPEPSRTTSGTTRHTAGSASSAESRPGSVSKTSSGRTTGSTSRDGDFIVTRVVSSRGWSSARRPRARSGHKGNR